jgi:thymidylate kinase
MLIIVEGADGTGKTTFCEALDTHIRGKWNVPVERLHRGVPEKPVVEEYTDDLRTYARGCGRHVVCDRWHLGELIYGPLYRGKSELMTGGLVEVETFLLNRGAVVVLLDGREHDVAERLKRRGEDYLKPEDLGRVLRDYRHVARLCQLPLLCYQNPTGSEVRDVVLTAEAFERSLVV